MKKEIIGTYFDKIIQAYYTLIVCDAKELSDYLKSNLKDKGIDYKKYNSESDDEGVAKNPPVEIYEYQNFVVMEMPDDSYVLLDGFRRLLWYKTPSTPINVRIYEKANLKNEQMFSLMIYLNHFKFYTNSDYYDRGFALLMKTVFEINILTYKYAFDAYLSCNEKDEDEIRNSYSSGMFDKDGNEKSLSVKERILQPQFISDMTFLEELNKNGAMVNKFIGVMIYMFRKKTDLPFNADEFIRIANANPVMPKLMERYKKTGTNSSAESQKAVNPILEIYENVFRQLLGGKAVKSHSELMVECRELSESIKKEKGWTKMTGSRNIYDIEAILLEKARDKKVVGFKMVIYPDSDKHKDFYGLADVKYKIKYEKNSNMSGKELRFEAKIGNETFQICHNYTGSWSRSYGKKYAYIEREWSLSEKDKKPRRYDIDFFVNLTKEEIETKLRERFPERYKAKEKPSVEMPEQKDKKINITTKNIREFVAGKDTIYLNKNEGGMNYFYLCKFKKFEKGIVTGEIIADDKSRHSVHRVGEEISARLTKCYLKGRFKESDSEHQCHWFDKDGTIS